MYLRFVVGSDKEHHRSLTGIITESRLLMERGELQPHEVELLKGIYEWFNIHLPCPPFETSSWPRDVVSWFKPTATEPIRKMWEIVLLLKEHDIPVRVLKSEMPGRSYYSDEYQILVLEKKNL